jgi:hypothetical protein
MKSLARWRFCYRYAQLHEYSDEWYPVRTASTPERSRSAADTVQLSQIADEYQSSGSSTVGIKSEERNIPSRAAPRS